MSEKITLAGGTLVPSSKAASMGSETVSLSSQNHGQSCPHHNNGHHHQRHGIEMTTIPNNIESIDELVKGSDEEISRVLSTLMRFGRYEAFPNILEIGRAHV